MIIVSVTVGTAYSEIKKLIGYIFRQCSLETAAVIVKHTAALHTAQALHRAFKIGTEALVISAAIGIVKCTRLRVVKSCEPKHGSHIEK